MVRSINMISAYLNFLMMMGVANATKPSYAEGLDTAFPAIPFFSWEAPQLSFWKQMTRELNNPAAQAAFVAERD